MNEASSSSSSTPPPASDRTRVLIIDDDRELCWLIKDYLEPLGYEVSAAHTGPDGLTRAVEEPFEAIILDVMLPGMNGFDLLQRLRAKTNVPVLMLTARGEETDRIVGLEFGADDYLPKTFSTRELLARLRAVTRRTARPASSSDAGVTAEREIVVGSLRLSPATRTAIVGDRRLDLTAIEFDLLECLARARGRVKTREQLIESITDRHYDVFDRSVDVHIWSLRKKLGDDPKAPRFIRTVRSVGYLLINPLAERP